MLCPQVIVIISFERFPHAPSVKHSVMEKDMFGNSPTNPMRVFFAFKQFLSRFLRNIQSSVICCFFKKKSLEIQTSSQAPDLV